MLVHQMTARRPTGHLRMPARAAALALLLSVSPLSLAAAGTLGAGGDAPFAELTPVSRAELADLRGGLKTTGGLEISFGMRVELDLDQVRLTTHFKPLPTPAAPETPAVKEPKLPEKPATWPGFREGGLEVTLARPTAGTAIGFTKKADGGFEVSAGDATASPIQGGTHYAFEDGTTAEVTGGAESHVLRAGGELPVRIEQDADSVRIKVGDEATTLVENLISDRGVSTRLTNRDDGAQVRQHAIFDINVLNHSQMSSLRKHQAQTRKIQNLINRGLLGFGARR